MALVWTEARREMSCKNNGKCNLCPVARSIVSVASAQLEKYEAVRGSAIPENKDVKVPDDKRYFDWRVRERCRA